MVIKNHQSDLNSSFNAIFPIIALYFLLLLSELTEFLIEQWAELTIVIGPPSTLSKQRNQFDIQEV